MSQRKSRFISLCQQVLTLCAVGAVTVTAAAVLDLEVTQSPDGSSTPGQVQTDDGSSAADDQAATEAQPQETPTAESSEPSGSGDTSADSPTGSTPAETPSESTDGGGTSADEPAEGEYPSTSSDDEAPVETAPVTSTVAEVPLTTADGAATDQNESAESADGDVNPASFASTSDATIITVAEESTEDEATPVEVVSEPQPITGYGAIGVTWSPEVTVAPEDIAFALRTRAEGGEWTGWEEIPYESTEIADAAADGDVRPGTELMFVGDVDEAQVRVSADDGVPADLSVAVVDPGASDTTLAAPEYAYESSDSTEATEPEATETPETPEATETPDATATPEATETPDATATPEPSTTETPEASSASGASSTTTSQITLASTTTTTSTAAASAAAASVTQPAIYSRAQWGADESLRDGSPRYATVKGAVIHHTVNSNNYTSAQVPGLIRGIYAYHTKSQGWSDIGYNFLVDRFGRLWEGRAGGITKAVRGAHISAYNDYAFGISAIGNYDITQPSAAMNEAIAQLIAWKLSVHGIAANSTQSWGGVTKTAIIGHRDGGQTACPGRYLYAVIPAIRSRATNIQRNGTVGASTPATTTVSYYGATSKAWGSTTTIGVNVTNIASGDDAWVGMTGLGANQYQKVRNGKVALSVPANIVPGTYTVRFKLNSDGSADGTTVSKTFTVTKANTTTAIGFTALPTTTRTGRINIAMNYTGNATGAVPRPSSLVTVQIVNSDGRTLRWRAAQKWVNNGSFEGFAIPALPRGTYYVQAIFEGNSTGNWSYGQRTITVR